MEEVEHNIIGCQGAKCAYKLNCYRHTESKSALKIRGINNSICDSFMSIYTGIDLSNKIAQEDKLFKEIIESYSSPTNNNKEVKNDSM